MAAATLQRLGLGVLGAHGLRRTSYGLKRSSSTLTNILADEANPPPVQVASIADDGIHLADGLAIPGACIFLEGKVFLWDIPQTLWDGWGNHHFKLFEIGAPRPEILLLGTGKTVSQPPPTIRAHLKSLGIQLDVTDTVSCFVSSTFNAMTMRLQRNACATYNLLSEEGRKVAAALLPLKPHKWQKTTLA
ncbi:hypothetical protein AX14_008554 [Amanita brunnescens Koide BX004]|nr:hypothetical protein AX14_008554 [Amanita brunnescens Koide BX004]